MLAPLDHLRRHATMRADDLAVVSTGYSLTFSQLAAAVDSTASRLRARGIRTGDLVALDLPTGAEWVVDLALLRLGVAGVSMRGVSAVTGIRYDQLLTEADGVAEDWFTDSTDAAPTGVFEGPDAIFRYLLTSGTTGAPRAAAYSLRAFEHRMSSGAAHWTDGRRELTLIGLSTTGGFHAAAGCLEHGIPYLAVDRIDAESMHLAAEQRIQVLCGSPVQVARALHVLKAEGIALTDLEEIRLAGAVPSARLIEFFEAELDVTVRSVYGSTEGGGVSQVVYGPGVDRYDVDRPLDGVDLQVVDAAGEPQPTGAEGAIRYRSPGQVSGYLVDGVVEPFVDGWFVPGDRGTLTDDGRLILGGRDSELLNLGGVKIDPGRIDESASDFPGMIDAAAFGIERRPGIPEAALAVVTGPDCDLRELDRRLRSLIPVGHPTAYWRIDAIPRSRLGKPLRAQLAADYDRVVLRRS